MSNILQLPKRVVEKVKEKRKRGKLPIRQWGDGYQARIRLDYGRINDTKTFPTYELAEDWYHKRVLELKYGKEPSVKEKVLKEWTIRKLIDAFIAFSETQPTAFHANEISFTNNKVLLNRFCRLYPELVDKKLSDVSADDWQDQQNDRLYGANKISNATYLRELNAITGVLTRFRKRQIPDMPRLPIPYWRKELVFRPEISRDARALTDDEYQRIITKGLPIGHLGRYAEGQIIRTQYHILIDLALDTGVRIGGLIKITWKDIEWNTNSYWQPPDKKSLRRQLPLKYEMMVRLHNYFEMIPAECRKPNHTIFFITMHKGKYGPMRQFSCRNVFYRIMERAEIKDFRMHWLRHTARTWMSQKYNLVDHERHYMCGTTKHRYEWATVRAIQEKLDPHFIGRTIFDPVHFRSAYYGDTNEVKVGVIKRVIEYTPD